jgi:anaerobic magnesium-protoporphyrin IX monomethyl ester cyclase
VDILLVNPLFLRRDPVEYRLMTPYFPLGLLYLAAMLRDAGYQVSVYDCMFRDGPEAFARTLDKLQPRVVGLGVLSTVLASALELAAIAHERGCTVLMGGADPTARPDSYLEDRVEGHCPVDIVVVGEGEETILELMANLRGAPDALPLHQIQGLVYRDEEGQIVRTGPRALRKNVDEIPFPARDLVDVDAYRRAWRAGHGYFSLSVISSRGCPFQCAWCQKSVFGRSYRPRSPESVAEEMGQIKAQYDPDQLRVVDDVLGIDRQWVKRWRDALVARDAVIPFECLSRVDLVDREVLTWLKEAGCIRISFGAESGSQKVLDAMAKGTKVSQAYQAAQLCHELGIEVYFFIMVGYPGETWEDIQATVRFLCEAAPDEFSSTIAYPLQGTPFYEQVRDRLITDHDWRHTAENRVLYKGEYSTRFYRWVQRWLHKEWQVARVRAGRECVERWARVLAGLWLSRIAVGLLRYVPADTRAVSVVPPCH